MSSNSPMSVAATRLCGIPRLIQILRSLLSIDGRSLLPHLLRGFVALSGYLALAVVISIVGRTFSQGALGLSLFRSLIFMNAVMVLILGPMLFSRLLSEEYELGEIDLVLMTGLSLREFVIAKWITKLFGVCAILAVQLPMAFLSVTLGGVAWVQVVLAFIWLGVLALVCASLSLWGSSFSRRPAFAATWAIVFQAIYFAPAVVVRGLDPTSGWPLMLHNLIHPLDLFSALNDIFWSPNQSIIPLATNTVLSLFIVLLAQLTFSRFLQRRSQYQSQEMDRELKTARRRPRFLTGADAVGQKDCELYGNGSRGLFRKSILLSLIVGGAVLVGFWYEQTLNGTTTFIAMTIVWFGPLISTRHAGLLCRNEFRQQTWGSLKQLPHSSTILARQKHSAGIAMAAPELVTALVTGLCLGIAMIYFDAQISTESFCGVVGGWIVLVLASQWVGPPMSILSEALKPINWTMFVVSVKTAAIYAAIFIGFGTLTVLTSRQEPVTTIGFGLLFLFLGLLSIYSVAMWQIEYWLQRREDD